MKKISYMIERTSVTRMHDALIVADSEYVGLHLELAEAITETISTGIEVTLGGVTIHLAMLLDPEHWETDWEERGVEDVGEFLTGLIEEEA